jgi:hypothetical protein
MGRGDVLVIGEDATQRADWARYLDAIGQAVTNGADVGQAANIPVRWALGVDQ